MTIATYPPAVNGSTPSAQLGYTDIPAFTGITTATTVASVTVFVPAGRRIKVTAHVAWNSTVAGDSSSTRIYEDGVHVGQDRQAWTASNVWCHAESVLSPSPGVHTYTVTVDRSVGTGTIGIIDGTGTNKASWLLVEDITGGTGGSGPIELAYAQVTAVQTGIPATGWTDLNGLSVTVSVPAGRRIKISAHGLMIQRGGAGTPILAIYEGNTRLNEDAFNVGQNEYCTANPSVVLTPSAGVHTYRLRGINTAFTWDLEASVEIPAFIQVEDITGTPSPAGILPTSQTLAYAQVTTGQTGITSLTDLTGLSVTVTVPAGRRLKISAWAQYEIVTSAGAAYGQIQRNNVEVGRWIYTDAKPLGHHTEASSFIDTPPAGQHTYKLNLSKWNGGGTISLVASATLPAYILVEDITGGQPAVAPNNVPVGLLGWADWRSNQSITQTMTALPLSVNVVVPEGRTLKISGRTYVSNGTSNARSGLYIFEDGVQKQGGFVLHPSTAAGTNTTVEAELIISPSAGSHTYELRGVASAGTSIFAGDNGHPALLTVEDITPTPAPANTAPSSTLGYAERTSNQLNISTEVDLTGLSTTVTVPAGRRLRITGFVPMFTRTAGTATYVNLIVNEDGTNKQRSYNQLANNWCVGTVEWITSPTAGTHTYKLRANSDGTVAIDIGNSIGPAFILVEDITGVSVDVHDHNSAPTSTLAYAQVTANQTGITTETDLVGLTVTVNVPAGRRLRISGEVNLNASVNDEVVELYIYEDGSMIQAGAVKLGLANWSSKHNGSIIRTPTAGIHTYKLTMRRYGSSTVTMVANPAYPAFIHVEDISGHGIPGHTHPQLDVITDSGWQSLSLLNGWVSYDNTYGPPRYRKVNGIVYVQGLIRSGTLGPSVAQLPVGFRPSLGKLLFAVERDSNVIGRADVQSDGHIIAALFSQGWTSLAGIIFPADQ